jgi:hypothetical protein
LADFRFGIALGSAIGADSRKRKSIAQMQRDGFIAAQHGAGCPVASCNPASDKARRAWQSRKPASAARTEYAGFWSLFR